MLLFGPQGDVAVKVLQQDSLDHGHGILFVCICAPLSLGPGISVLPVLFSETVLDF